jgi:hypothetical protein
VPEIAEALLGLPLGTTIGPLGSSRAARTTPSPTTIGADLAPRLSQIICSAIYNRSSALLQVRCELGPCTTDYPSLCVT